MTGRHENSQKQISTKNRHLKGLGRSRSSWSNVIRKVECALDIPDILNIDDSVNHVSQAESTLRITTFFTRHAFLGNSRKIVSSSFYFPRIF